MRKPGCRINSMAYSRVDTPMSVRLEAIEQRLGKLILQSDKESLPAQIEDAILTLSRTLGVNEKVIRQSAVFLCSAKLQCLECHPLKGCRSRI